MTRKSKPNPDETSPGDNSRFLAFALATYDLPPIDPSNARQVEDRIRWYFQHCLEEDMKPGIVGLANALGVDRLTLRYWADGKYRRATHTPLIRKAYDFIEENMELYMMNGKINPASGIFLMKNNYGYKDQTDIQLAPPEQNQEIPAEQLRQKYLGSVVDVDVCESKAVDWNNLQMTPTSIPAPDPEALNVVGGVPVPEYMRRTDNEDLLPKRNFEAVRPFGYGDPIMKSEESIEESITIVPEDPSGRKPEKPIRAKQKRIGDLTFVLGDDLDSETIERMAIAQGLKSRNLKTSRARKAREDEMNRTSESANVLGPLPPKPTPKRFVKLREAAEENKKKNRDD